MPVDGRATSAELEALAGLDAAALVALVAGAPAALDTLNELAAALGDDAAFATTITAALSGKQPLDADLTAIAALSTTAFGRGLLVLADGTALAALVPNGPFVAQTDNYTLTASDRIVTFSGTTLTATLPSAVTMAAGKRFTIKNINASPVTVATTSAQTIDGEAPGTLAEWAVLDVVSDGANWLTV